jgi:hypothetical protein
MPKPAKPAPKHESRRDVPIKQIAGVDAPVNHTITIEVATRLDGTFGPCVCCGNPVAVGAACPVDGTVA